MTVARGTFPVRWMAKDGESVTVKTWKVYYVESNQGKTPPTSGWKETIPNVEQGDYLWTWTHVEYSDGTSTDTYSVSYIGMDAIQYSLKVTGTRTVQSGSTLTTADTTIYVDGSMRTINSARGLCLCLMTQWGSIKEGNWYDVYGTKTGENTSAITDFIAKLKTYHDPQYVVVVVSHDAISMTTEMQAELENFGGNDSWTVDASRVAYVFIGQYGMQKGTAYFDHEEGADVTLQACVNNGVLTPCGGIGETVTIRRTEWAATNPDGKTFDYKDGTKKENGVLILDVVTVSDTTNNTFEEYVCRKSHTSSEDKKPSSTSEYWKLVNNVGPIRTPLLDAQYVIAQYLQAHNIKADRLETVGDNNRSVVIEDGMIQVFGTKGTANIRFGVDSSGRAILSYYDNDGTWLYDLGPNGLDGGSQTGATIETLEYVLTSAIYSGTIHEDALYSLGRFTMSGVKVESACEYKFFGTRLYVDDDDEVNKNNRAHVGFQPAKGYTVTNLYKYTAARQQGSIIKDNSNNIPTATLAKEADGRYFTSRTVCDGTTLVNLANGEYILYSNTVNMSPEPMTEVDVSGEWPAYVIKLVSFTNGVATNILMFSQITRTLSSAAK